MWFLFLRSKKVPRLRHAYDEKLHHQLTCFLNTRVVTTVEYPVHFVTFVQISLTAVRAEFYTLKY